MALRKILVADDSLTIQKVIRLALSAGGAGDTYDIQAVSEGNEALQQIAVFRPEVVIIDVSLPGQSAFEVKAKIDSETRAGEFAPRFILMSSAFETLDEAHVLRSGFHGRLTKPFDPGHLRQVIQDALAQSSPQKTPGMAPPPPPPFEPLDSDAHESHAAPEIKLELDFPSPPPPPPPPSTTPSVEMHDSETDIKKLTESTLKMSGFEDFEWSVDEPSLKPPAALRDHGGSNFPIEPTGFTPRELPSSLAPDVPDSDIPEISASSASLVSDDTGTLGLDPTQVERLAREAIEREVRKVLPDIAERIIKAEIHRLLMEQP